MRVPRNLLNLKDVDKGYASRSVLRKVTLGISAGDRIGVVGGNGDGKSTLLRLIAGVEPPDGGSITRTGDLDLALLGQGDELDERRTIREALVGERAEHEWAGINAVREILDGLLGGVQMRRFPHGLDTVIAPLSGGERRRLQLMRLLMGGPNVLLLDEPTNDLDIDTLTALEDLLDSWPGTLIVVSHDRYFVERVCDDVYALTPDGAIRHLPGGIDQYIERRRDAGASASASAPTPPRGPKTPSSASLQRAARKQIQRLERALDRLAPIE
jgi:ABC transport system ATP-binding/permease protein